MDDKFYLSMMDKFNSSAIAELEFNDGNTRFALRKEGAKSVCLPRQGEQPLSADTAAANAQAPESIHLGISTGEGEKIKSPIVATYYSSPSPDSPPFVKVGAKITAGQTLCILEAMKMMNHLEAEFDCEILEIHAANGEMVEYGQELFTVRK